MKAYAGDEYFGDGCDWNCNWDWVGEFTCNAVLPTVCTEICGAGTFDFYTFPCDDGNNLDGDGCSATC
jgi:cysteine-rich repeat protein